MNNPFVRFIVIALLFLVTLSCATHKIKAQPKVLKNAEYSLQQGTQAYGNDEYPSAARYFTKALHIYQSVDHSKGVLDSYINLIETAIAIGNVNMANQLIEKVEPLSKNKPYSERLTLLQVKTLFHQQEYQQALELLNPLVIDLYNNAESVNFLNIVSSKAQLEVLTKSPDAPLWLQRFKNGLNPKKITNDRFMAVLLRTQALQKQFEGNFKESKQLVHQALSIHHKSAYRRGIATSLQQLASLEEEQNNWKQADFYLKRALNIHLWTLNKTAAIKDIHRLININKKLNNSPKVELYMSQLEKLK